MKICVIMSTYNGVKYVEEQLDSIINQDVDASIMVYIRDDGSTDDTIDILRKYAAGHREVDFTINAAANMGASGSFLTAMRECPDADIYAFSDQDDIWEQGKLRAAALALADKGGPALWFSNYSVVDKDQKVIDPNGMGMPCLDQFKVLFYNNNPGCVIVFNRALLVEIRKLKIDTVRMHDVVALNIALLTGHVIYDERVFHRYRQHGDNVLGYTHKKIHPVRWLKDKISLVIDKEPYDTSEYAREVLDIWHDRIGDSAAKEYALIGGYRKSLAKRLVLLSRPYTKEPFGRTRLTIRCQILLGLM